MLYPLMWCTARGLAALAVEAHSISALKPACWEKEGSHGVLKQTSIFVPCCTSCTRLSRGTTLLVGVRRPLAVCCYWRTSAAWPGKAKLTPHHCRIMAAEASGWTDRSAAWGCTADGKRARAGAGVGG